ncbi:MAG: addiction module protein [Ignavibacteriaceae bacterium]|nr:addiction module protein [Ignavibacteriaceae bacterium]
MISAKEDFPISDEQKKELDLRLEAYYRNPSDGKPWEEVRNNMQSQM